MKSKAARQSLVWSAVLVLAGVLLLIDAFTDLSAWIWVVILAASGLGALGLYLTDRSDYGVLLTAYVLCVIAVLIALVTLDVLRDEAVAFYVLIAIALPFLVVFYRNRAQWWALIPAYVLSAVAIMVLLTGLGLLSDALVPAYVLLAIAIPFFVVYLRNRRQWWWLIPGGVLAVIGIAFLIAEASIASLGAVALIAVGGWILLRGVARRETASDAPSPTDPESEV